MSSIDVFVAFIGGVCLISVVLALLAANVFAFLRGGVLITIVVAVLPDDFAGLVDCVSSVRVFFAFFDRDSG